uniref:Single stranded DNA-binding protein n=1 Tax=Geladintestivirus 2 TaxID=3233134 RepID=A0AAU8MIF5_9CAUD
MSSTDNVKVENSKAPQTEQQVKVKRNKRGVSNQTKATSQLKFHEKDAAQNGLFVGHLDSISVDWSTNAEGKQFTGESVPRVTLHFASNHSNSVEQRHVYYTINCVESNVNTIPGGSEEWKVNNVFNWLKHILDVYYLKGRELTEEEEDALSLPFEDYDEANNYIAVDTTDVIKGYQYIFENFVAMMNGSFNLADGETPKPVYKTADGKFIPAWLKLLRHKKVKNEWRNVGQNGELGFDTFIGNGVVELIKKDMPPMILRVDLAKESITPKETKKTPTLGIGGMNNVPSMGGVTPSFPMNMGMDNGSAFTEADADMPF